MPRLLVFAPCEKVIVDQQNNPTLICLLSEWASGVPDPPDKAIAAKQWEVFALWQRMADDADREFVQVCELTTESGVKAIKADMQFRMTAETQRNTIVVIGLPINPGRYDLSVYLHEAGSDKERQLCGTYPLFVKPFA